MSLLRLVGIERISSVYRQQAGRAYFLRHQPLLVEDCTSRFVSFETLFGMSEYEEGWVDLDWNSYVWTLDAELGPKNVPALPRERLVPNFSVFLRRLNTFLSLAEDHLIPYPKTHEHFSRNDTAYRDLAIDGTFLVGLPPRPRRTLHRLAAEFLQLLPRFIWEGHPNVALKSGPGAVPTASHRSQCILIAPLAIAFKEGHGYS